MTSDTPPIAAQGVATLPDEAWAQARHRTEIIGPLAALEVVGHEAADEAAQRLGFSLDEIAELLRLEDGTHCEEASSLAEHKLKDVRERMADLARMEAVLSDLVCACHARKGNVSCPLIASLQGKKEPRSADAV